MRRVILAIVATATGLVFLLSFKTHTQAALGTRAAALGTPTPGGASTAGPAASSAKKSTAQQTHATGGARSAGPSASAGGAAKTVTGEAIDTIYGPVQVKITVKDGKITAVTAVQYPMNTQLDYQINSYAIPALNQETLQASSANIDAVSGATYTSQGYIGSLQNAVDQAGL